MDKRKEYETILKTYPKTISKDQMYKICHISKSTCLYLLEKKLVPCIDTGKKTHRFHIRIEDVINYLEDRETDPQKYVKPKSKKIQKPCPLFWNIYALPDIDNDFKDYMKHYYEILLREFPEVLETLQITAITGYAKNSVMKWGDSGKLWRVMIKKKYLTPKNLFIDFLCSDYFVKIKVKSDKHIEMNKKIYEAYVESKQK